jgi:hypothetical protein
MDSTHSIWIERLKGWVFCKECGDHIKLVDVVLGDNKFLWTHVTVISSFCSLSPNPVPNELNFRDSTKMGFVHGTQGISVGENPFIWGNPLWCTSNELKECWRVGWKAAQSEILTKVSRQTIIDDIEDGFSHLDYERMI